VIKGKHNQVTLTESNLALAIQAGSAQWNLMPSIAGDMLVKSKGEDISLRIADAKKITIVPYDTGFKTGLKISASGWQQKGIEDRGRSNQEIAPSFMDCRLLLWAFYIFPALHCAAGS
jgi:hypothetical protein